MSGAHAIAALVRASSIRVEWTFEGRRTTGEKEAAMNLSDAINHVMDLAGKVRDYYDTEFPKWHPNYPLVNPDEADPPPPPEEGELMRFFQSLPADTVYRVALILYLGRGHYGTDDLARGFEDMHGLFADSEQAASQMVAYSPLADYLEFGLEALRDRGIDVDELPLNGVAAQKR